ncbi:hypothetical protein GY50_0698 [Dehalococcoides mccartyi GY50]|nr:hypothetical protein GY50_0698 [Dehalococcoides mccartyi GY50]
MPCLAVTRQGKSNKGSVSTMLDIQEYTTQIDQYQGNGNGNNGNNGNGNGYSQLQGDWSMFYKVAKGFTKRVRPEDRQDFLHDLLLTMHKVKAKYDVIGKELTEAGLIRVACYEVAQYWRNKFRRKNGIDCGRCSREQRQKCKANNLYGECPKAVRLESLDRLLTDADGNQIELSQMIADDNAVDVSDRLDARLTLQSYPHRFVRIAYKKYAGYPLTVTERQYLYRQRSKAYKISQKSLVFA